MADSDPAVSADGARIAFARGLDDRAPAPPRPQRPRRLRARRRGSAIKVSWRPGRGAASQRVVVSRPHGRRDLLVVKARRRKLRVAEVDRNERVTIEVAGLRRDNVPGRSAKVRVKPRR